MRRYSALSLRNDCGESSDVARARVLRAAALRHDCGGSWDVAKGRVRRANGVEGIVLNSVWECTSSRIDWRRVPLCWTNGMSCSDAASGCGCTTWSVEGDVTGSVAGGRAGLDSAVDRAEAATQCGTRKARAPGAYDLFCESIVAVEGAYNSSCDGIVAGEGGAYDSS